MLYTTFPDSETASSTASALIELRLIACANIIPNISSIYTWEEKICNGNECIMILKTTRDMLDQAVDKLRNIHPYNAPCILEITLEKTVHSQPYHDWLTHYLCGK